MRFISTKAFLASTLLSIAVLSNVVVSNSDTSSNEEDDLHVVEDLSAYEYYNLKQNGAFDAPPARGVKMPKVSKSSLEFLAEKKGQVANAAFDTLEHTVKPVIKGLAKAPVQYAVQSAQALHQEGKKFWDKEMQEHTEHVNLRTDFWAAEEALWNSLSCMSWAQFTYSLAILALRKTLLSVVTVLGMLLKYATALIQYTLDPESTFTFLVSIAFGVGVLVQFTRIWSKVIDSMHAVIAFFAGLFKSDRQKPTSADRAAPLEEEDEDMAMEDVQSSPPNGGAPSSAKMAAPGVNLVEPERTSKVSLEEDKSKPKEIHLQGGAAGVYLGSALLSLAAVVLL